MRNIFPGDSHGPLGASERHSLNQLGINSPINSNLSSKTHFLLFAHNILLHGHSNTGGMYMTEKNYGKLVQEMAPKSPCWKDYLNAFWIGGVICLLGQLALTGYQAL